MADYRRRWRPAVEAATIGGCLDGWMPKEVAAGSGGRAAGGRGEEGIKRR
jgi:hypothetical protein